MHCYDFRSRFLFCPFQDESAVIYLHVSCCCFFCPPLCGIRHSCKPNGYLVGKKSSCSCAAKFFVLSFLPGVKAVIFFFYLAVSILVPLVSSSYNQVCYRFLGITCDGGLHLC